MVHGQQDYDKDPIADESSVLEQVPVIDIAQLLIDSASDAAGPAIRQIADACSSWGFFQVVNHGVPRPLIDATWQETRRFFAQPADVKGSTKAIEAGRKPPE